MPTVPDFPGHHPGGYRTSSKVGDLDLHFQGHSVSDVCGAPFFFAIYWDLIVLHPSHSECRCIFGSSRTSSKVGDLDLLFQGHSVSNMCRAPFISQ